MLCAFSSWQESSKGIQVNFLELDVKLQAAIVSAITSLFIFGLGWLFKVFHENYSLNYKLQKEYKFEQKKLLKEEIVKTKVPLLNAAEEFNYRIFNFNKNISKGYHNISEKEWFQTNQYYLNSFIYRFLVLIHFCIKTEEDLLSMDSTVADEEDITFLLYVKTFKNIFCESNLLTELGYKQDDDSNHFYRNELKGFSGWVVSNNKVIEFDEFVPKLKHSYDPLRRVIEYFSKIDNDDKDKTLNILRCTHLLSICFLNEFGHSYQQTDKGKIKKLNQSYKDKIKIKASFLNFLDDSKLKKKVLSNFKAGLAN